VTGTLPVANGGTGAATLTANNVLLGNGTSALQAVAPGSSGNVLTSNGTTWSSTAPAGGGSLILLQTVTGTSVNEIDVTGNFSSTYKFYKLFVTCATSSSVAIEFRLFINGTVQETNLYGFTQQRSSSGSAFTYTNSSSAGAISPNMSAKNIAYEIWFFNPSNTDHRNAIHYSGASSTDGPDSTNVFGWGNWLATGTAGQRAITGIRVMNGSSTNFTARLYGIKEA
jgi:hypothetical protein